MVRSLVIVVGGVVLGICAAAAQVTSIDGRTAPAAAMLQRAALYLDRSSAQLDRLVATIQSGTASEVDAALQQYTREFSQFHVTVGRLRIGKQEVHFAARAVKELDSQVSRLDALRQNPQQQRRAVAVGEAVSHLKSALQMIKQRLDSKSRGRLLNVHGAGPSAPDTTIRWWEPRP